MSSKIDKKLDGIAGSLASIESMTAGQINKALDRLDVIRSEQVDIFIEVGRGFETPSETMMGTDPLSRQFQRLDLTRTLLRNEIERRYGPGAPRRLPTRR